MYVSPSSHSPSPPPTPPPLTPCIEFCVTRCYVVDLNFSLANPSLSGAQEHPQPNMFIGQLKAYQLKGMNWLASLYNQVRGGGGGGACGWKGGRGVGEGLVVEGRGRSREVLEWCCKVGPLCAGYQRDPS